MDEDEPSVVERILTVATKTGTIDKKHNRKEANNMVNNHHINMP